MYRWALLLLFLPITTHAALNAGVVSGVWFSNPNPKEGEEVRIFTAVQNQSNEIISGTVAFLVDDDIIGSTQFLVRSNDIVPVSITHIFYDGDYDVSAYITSVEETNVVYTTVSDTSVSVSPASLPNTVTETTNKPAVSQIGKVLEEVLDTGSESAEEILPAINQVANKVEEVRDALVTSGNTAATSSPTVLSEKPSAKEVTQKFMSDSKRIISTDGLALWKKVTGVVLSAVVFLLRFWYVLVTLLFVFIFWRLVRGRRIR